MSAIPTEETHSTVLLSRLADLRAVLLVSRELMATSELVPLLRRVECAALQVLHCERATVLVYDRERGELYSKLATGVDEIRFSADRGIAGEGVKTRSVINVADAYSDPRFNPDIDRLTGFQTRNLLSLPLFGFDGEVVGVLQLLNKVDGAFSGWDDELARTFGAMVGVALQRQLLLDHYAEKRRIQQDLETAHRIQQALLPQEPPKVEGFDIAGWNRPAHATGGDGYDFFPLPEGTLAMSITDATGHGIGPALMMAECRALFRAAISVSRDLGALATRVNDLLCQDTSEGRFVTACFALLQPRSAQLSFISAGHAPVILYRRDMDEITPLNADCPPLGVMPTLPLAHPNLFGMHSGDMMVLVTDGFFEWAGGDDERFGLERLYEVIRRERDSSAAQLIQAMLDAAVAFVGDTAQEDDLTAVVIKKI